MEKLKPYPTWICNDCGNKACYSQHRHPSLMSTYHIGICDVCGEKTFVTEPRDFGYPKFRGHKYD